MFPPENAPAPVLAIPGYLQAGDAIGQRLQDYRVWWDDHAAAGEGPRATGPRWAAESPKRFLAAQIAVGTIDQALLGALKVKHAHLRAASLARNLLVVDEVHASDVYMSAVLEALLAAHHGAGGYALLMSATLGSEARQRWLRPGRRNAAGLSLEDAIAVAYPAISVRRRAGDGSSYEASITAAGGNGQDKAVAISAIPQMSDFAAVAQQALAAARAGAKVLIIRNTVNHAIQTQAALQELAGPGEAGLLFAVNGIPTLHHGRFAAADRKLLDARIEALLGRGESRPSGGLVVVGTQTLEQSLDIDADLLLTDLCPADVLLQRIGRLHRHPANDAARPAAYAAPQCLVLTPPGGDLSPLLQSGREANGLGPHGGVYRSLPTLEATRRLIDARPQWRLPAMNRELVERATHRQALDAIKDEMGEDWEAHTIDNDGRRIADRQLALGHLIRRDQSLFTGNRETLFPGDEERIRTRLGDDRLELPLTPPQPSPLDPSRSINQLAIPLRWLGQTEIPDKDEYAITPTRVEGGFEFSIGDRKFRYDRLGLRRV